MPELKEVSAWHQFGQRRSLEEFGRVMRGVSTVINRGQVNQDVIYEKQ